MPILDMYMMLSGQPSPFGPAGYPYKFLFTWQFSIHTLFDATIVLI